MQTVTPFGNTVNCADDVTVEVDGAYGLTIHRFGRLQAGLELGDAIRVARLVLAYAERYDLAASAEDAEAEALAEKYEAMLDAQADAVSAHWGHD